MVSIGSPIRRIFLRFCSTGAAQALHFPLLRAGEGQCYNEEKWEEARR